MLLLSLAVLLVCASSQVMAQNGRTTAAHSGACQDAEAVAREDAGHTTSTSDSKAAAARSKYAKPANSATGNGGTEENLPRLRGSKWHSFLPGMFR